MVLLIVAEGTYFKFWMDPTSETGSNVQIQGGGGFSAGKIPSGTI